MPLPRPTRTRLRGRYVWFAFFKDRALSLRLLLHLCMGPHRGWRKQPCADCTRLLHRGARRTISDIRARELERAPTVVAAAGVELRGMVREGEQVLPEKLLEAKPCGVEVGLRLFEPLLRDQHVGKAPADLRIAARDHRQEQRLRVARLVSAC